jgi:hypothetical protein
MYFLQVSSINRVLNENDETVQERLKLQCNRTSFTQEQINALEQGILLFFVLNKNK